MERLEPFKDSITVDSWIQDHGVPVDLRRVADRKGFNRAILEFQANAEPAQRPRRRGPKLKMLPRLVEAMQEDIQQGKMTSAELENRTPRRGSRAAYQSEGFDASPRSVKSRRNVRRAGTSITR